jgi:hypothetical protein
MYRSHDSVYGSSKPSSLSSTEGDFTSTASMVGSGEKLGMDPQIGQPLGCGLCQGPFFLRAMTLSIAIDDCVKGYYCGPCEIRMVLDQTRTERGNRVTCGSSFPLQGVHQFKSL